MVTSPSKDKGKKKLSYKKKMMARYNITDKEFDEQKKDAQQQLKNWEEYRKEQVLVIFQSTSEYISKSKKSDVVHPKMARSKTVLNRQGQKVEVEYGRLKEYYLLELAPCKDFVWIRDQAIHEEQLSDLRAKQKQNFELRKDKQHTRLQMQKEYEKSKSVYEEPVLPRQVKAAARSEPKESVEESVVVVKFACNTTDSKHAQFPDCWYKQPISRSQIKPGKMVYWMGNEDDDDQLMDDDPEGKYTVTAERMIETLTAGGKVKDSGVLEPTSSYAKNRLTESIPTVNTKYKKTSGKEIVFLNTLKGTIDFMKKQDAPGKTKTSNTISQDEPTDALNQITFDPKITAHVFKGNRIRRQLGGKKDLETFEESRKDYTREAGEETSGI